MTETKGGELCLCYRQAQ